MSFELDDLREEILELFVDAGGHSRFALDFDSRKSFSVCGRPPSGGEDRLPTKSIRPFVPYQEPVKRARQKGPSRQGISIYGQPESCPFCGAMSPTHSCAAFGVEAKFEFAERRLHPQSNHNPTGSSGTCTLDRMYRCKQCGSKSEMHRCPVRAITSDVER